MECVPDALRICEVMTRNGSTLTWDGDSWPDWVELENASDQEISLSGYALITESKPSAAFAFPAEALPPHGRVVVCCGGSGGAYHAPFSLSAAGKTLLLLNRHGQVADIVTPPSLGRDQVWCRDAAGEWTLSDFPTPGEANRVERLAVDGSNAPQPQVARGALALTEVMGRNATFFADEDGNYPDYIEIHNTTAEPVSLEGWALSDSRSELKKWVFPAITLPGDGYLAVHCSGEDRREDPAHLHAGFRLDGDEAYAVIDSAIDIQNYMEFMSLEMFVGNTDAANIKRYRNPKRDGKWRWILYDLDMTLLGVIYDDIKGY